MPELSANTSRVKDPKWTGEGNEIAVMVSRGEPRRSNEQMREAVGDQIRRYLLRFPEREFNEANVQNLVGATVDLIAKNYIDVEGGSSVWLYRDHLLKFVRRAHGELGES